MIGDCSVFTLRWVILIVFIHCLSFCPAHASGIKEVLNNAASLQIHGRKGWLPTDVSQLKLVFSPPLEQGVDFSIWAEPSNHVIPPRLQFRRHQPSPLHLLLTPGKKWIKDLSPNTTQDLLLKSVKQGNTDLLGYKHSIPGKEDVVAKIVAASESMNVCPPNLQLPGATRALQDRLDKVLQHCQNPLIIPSRDLKWKQFQSLSLLLLQPAMLIVTGTDQPMHRAAKSVDRFLAAHSVLDIVWEPLTLDEPQYWVLIPRPLGMPGHMFAAMDALQWRHPLVGDPSLSLPPSDER